MITHVIGALSFAIAYFFSAHVHAVMVEVHRVERRLVFAELTAAAAVPPMLSPCIGLGTLTALRPA